MDTEHTEHIDTPLSQEEREMVSDTARAVGAMHDALLAWCLRELRDLGPAPR